MVAETAPGTIQTISTEQAKSETLSLRTERGRAVIQRNVIWALGAGVVPFPLVDAVAILAVELKMLKQLSDVYDVKFTKGVAKKLVSSLLTSLGSVAVGTAVAGSLAKFVPIVGVTLGFVSVPVFAAAFTHATGKVFQMHFETGGTLLDFDPKAIREHFRQEFEKSKEHVTHLHQEVHGAAAKDHKDKDHKDYRSP